MFQPDCRLGVALSFTDLGYVAHQQGDYSAARTLFEESAPIFRELGDKPCVAMTLNNLGLVDRDQGNYRAARTWFEEGLAMFRELEAKTDIAQSLNNLGLVDQDQGDYVSAKIQHEQSLIMFRTLGDKKGISVSMEAFARLAATEGQSIRAARLWGAAEVLRAEIRSPMPPNKRLGFERNTTEAREAVGEEMFEAAWAQGRSMSLEQAIEYALKVGVD